ncbi:uncharacterized protein [Henckelia pumila]|uniref:uncharacterized protein n=1 Tax=Henckelia pumila TaxID=405737 RepID=UPI003C6E309C
MYKLSLLISGRPPRIIAYSWMWMQVSIRKLSGGLGRVVRNHRGHVMVAFGKGIQISGSVVMGELLAIREGLQVFKDKLLSHIFAFSESLLAVQAVTESICDLSYTGHCALEVRDLISELNIVSLSHASRKANVVAHSLAEFVFFFPCIILLGA